MVTRTLALGVLALAALAGFAMGGRQFSTPDRAIQAFVAAINAGDVNSASGFVKNGKVNAQMKGFATAFKSGQLKVTIVSTSSVVDGKKAKVKVESRTVAGGNTQTQAETVQMERSSVSWLIVPPPAKDRVASKGAINSLAIMFSEGLSRIFADAKERAKNTVALSHIKQLGVGTLMFANDHDDKVATTPANWHKSVFPYVKNEAIFRAPGDPKKGDSFNLNPAIANKSLMKVRDPAKTVMLYQGRNGKLEFYNDVKAAVAFCDGSARVFTQEGAMMLNWKP